MRKQFVGLLVYALLDWRVTVAQQSVQDRYAACKSRADVELSAWLNASGCDRSMRASDVPFCSAETEANMKHERAYQACNVQSELETYAAEESVEAQLKAEKARLDKLLQVHNELAKIQTSVKSSDRTHWGYVFYVYQRPVWSVSGKVWRDHGVEGRLYISDVVSLDSLRAARLPVNVPYDDRGDESDSYYQAMKIAPKTVIDAHGKSYTQMLPVSSIFDNDPGAKANFGEELLLLRNWFLLQMKDAVGLDFTTSVGEGSWTLNAIVLSHDRVQTSTEHDATDCWFKTREEAETERRRFIAHALSNGSYPEGISEVRIL